MSMLPNKLVTVAFNKFHITVSIQDKKSSGQASLLTTKVLDVSKHLSITKKIMEKVIPTDRAV